MQLDALLMDIMGSAGEYAEFMELVLNFIPLGRSVQPSVCSRAQLRRVKRQNGGMQLT